MIRRIKTGLAFAALSGAFPFQPTLLAQDAMKQDSMKQDDMKHDKMQDGKMQDGKMMTDGKAKTLETGEFHAKVHPTSPRATRHQQPACKLLLRFTNFQTSH